jgi:hypothetical protein
VNDQIPPRFPFVPNTYSNNMPTHAATMPHNGYQIRLALDNKQKLQQSGFVTTVGTIGGRGAGPAAAVDININTTRPRE